MRTQQEIDDEVTALRQLRQSVPPMSLFNDDNIGAISAQLDVLENLLTTEGTNIVYGVEDDAAFDPYVLEAAHVAADWLSGASDEKPSEGWS